MTDPQQQQLIAPPPKQVAAWRIQWCNSDESGVYEEWLAACAAQWGADQAFEACLKELESIPSQFGIPFGKMAGNALRNARRPKPPSLKEQAIAELEQIPIDPEAGVLTSSLEIIRRALEALPDA